jgi:hypothetical protein
MIADPTGATSDVGEIAVRVIGSRAVSGDDDSVQPVMIPSSTSDMTNFLEQAINASGWIAGNFG